MNKKGKTTILFLLVVSSTLLLILSSNSFKQFDSNNLVSIEGNKKSFNKSPQSSILSNESFVIVFFNNSWYSQSARSNFTYHGGNIKDEWNNTFSTISGFAGIIPTYNLSHFQYNVSDATIETNEIIETQLNYASLQVGAVNSTWYLNGLKGNTNSSIAVLDSGINPNQILFPDHYNPTYLSGTIVGWQNFVDDGDDEVSDDNGHGTFISSIISGTGIRTYNSSVPTVVNLYGNYSHLDLFDSLTPGNYSLKIFTFNVSKENSHIFMNSSCSYDNTEIDGFWFELYNSSSLVNTTRNMTQDQYYTVNHSISSSGQGIYDLYLKYHKKIQAQPIFSFNASVSFFPEFYVENYSYFTGIANATKIVSFKIVNQTGIGYTSDLISALASVIQNKSKYHIVSVCLSIGTLGDDVVAINRVINEVINNGTLVVIAAGNSGIEGSDPLNKLALNKNAIVVGAINDEDRVTSYSSMGKNVGDGILKPDIVAPGGSKVPGHRLIIGADSKSNETTAGYGTSISAAIVSAAINVLIEAKWDDWDNYIELNLTNLVKTIKSILLMTASETNLVRENDPSTDIDESAAIYSPSSYNPVSGIGLKDIHEGYGRLNIEAAIDALIKFMEANLSVSGSLNSSEENPLGAHVFARRIKLTANKQYIFNLSEVDDNADFDLYLYSNETDVHGEPILLESSRGLLGNFNYLYYIPRENETECIITVKAIEGNSKFKLNASTVLNEYAPVLNITEVSYTGGEKNTTVMNYFEYIGYDAEKNYTLDRYLFFIEYFDNDTSNVPPQEIHVSINETGKNYTLSILNLGPYSDINFSEGVVYVSDQIQFNEPGNYSYFFVASDGPNRVRYPEIGYLNLTIVLPIESKRFPYIHSFNDGLGDWSHDGTGWDILQQDNGKDDRSRIYSTSWNSLYFGINHEFPNNYSYQSILITEDYPNGTITSPIINLTRISKYMHPFAKFGLRTSINSEDFVYLEMSVNRSDWIRIETYTNEEQEWFIEEINLTRYINSYVQFRLVTALDENFDPINYKGIMLDFFAIENYSNNSPPKLDPDFDITPSEGLEFEKFTFTCNYFDSDNNYPEFVYIEMDGKNYSMVNIYGDWDARSNEPTNRGILFQKSLILADISDKSFRFHFYDGKFTNSSQWYNKNDDLITFKNPEPLTFRYSKSGTYIGFQFPSDNLDRYYVAGNPLSKESTAWLLGDNMWHTVTRLEHEYLYGGMGQSHGGVIQGYGSNWNAKLITRPLELEGERDVYLEYDFEINLQSEYGADEDSLDKCIVSISTDYGKSWEILREYIYTDENLTGSEKIDISSYWTEVVMVMFTLDSNDNVEGTGYGWLLNDIYIGYDKASDFIAPTIEIKNPLNQTSVNSTISIEAIILDDNELDVSRLKIYINTEGIENRFFNFDVKNGTLTFIWNTTSYSDGIYVVRIVAFDKEGNRAEESITITVNNYLINWEKWAPWIIFIVVSVIIGVTMVVLTEKKGKLWVDKMRNLNAERVRIKSIDKDQVIKRIELISTEEELNRPLTVYCKFCRSWFSADHFDIMCPICEKDQLFIALNCMNCGKWYFKSSEEGQKFCKKCDGVRLVRQEKEDIQEILARDGIYLRKFEKNKKK